MTTKREMTLAPEQREAVERMIETVDRNLKKWRTWFPDEESCVDVPRSDLLALVECGRIVLSQPAPTCGTCGGTKTVLGLQRTGQHSSTPALVPCPECSGGKGE